MTIGPYAVGADNSRIHRAVGTLSRAPTALVVLVTSRGAQVGAPRLPHIPSRDHSNDRTPLMASRKRHSRSSGRSSRSWDAVAAWYTGWVGAAGSEHHRRLAVPAILDLLALSPGEHVLDFGCGPGVLAPDAARVGARYTGLDTSPRLLAFARRHHGSAGRFLV